ncbi:hypothetical protein J7894_00585, partial [Mycoplasmopsis agalactiae]
IAASEDNDPSNKNFDFFINLSFLKGYKIALKCFINLLINIQKRKYMLSNRLLKTTAIFAA